MNHMPQYPGGGDLWEPPLPRAPNKLLRATIQVGAAVAAIGVLAAVHYGVFSLVCTQHDWTTYWRWFFRAGCM